MNRPRITVVGSFAVGVFIRTPRMPVFGETLIGSDFFITPGGKGSNQAVGAARLGADTWFGGIIGEDKLGDIAVELYTRDGVHQDHLCRTPEMATGVGIIILEPAGRNGIILDMGANKLMDAAYVDGLERQIAASNVVMTVLEIPVPAAVRAMALGKRAGVRTIMNPAPAAPLDEDDLCGVDILTPNESELRILLGLLPDDPTPTPHLARGLRRCGVNTIVVTMGGEGALLLTDQEETHVPGVPVDVVDTTGAGDAFNAGLAVALAEGRPMLQAVQFANCAGALACSKLGVVEALAHRPAVDGLWLRNYN